MIEIVLALVFGAVVCVVVQVFQQELEAERARVNDLLRLLEAKAAPAEVAAYLAPDPIDEDEGSWISSADGLVVVRVEDD